MSTNRNDDELDWDRDEHGRMADFATAPEDEPATVADGDETGE